MGCAASKPPLEEPTTTPAPQEAQEAIVVTEEPGPKEPALDQEAEKIKDQAAGEIQSSAAAFLAKRRDEQAKDEAAAVIQGGASYIVAQIKKRKEEEKEAEAALALAPKPSAPTLDIDPVGKVVDSIVQLSHRIFGGDAAVDAPGERPGAALANGAAAKPASPSPGAEGAEPRWSEMPEPRETQITGSANERHDSRHDDHVPATIVEDVDYRYSAMPEPRPTLIAAGGRANEDPEHRFSAMPEPRPTMIADGGRTDDDPEHRFSAMPEPRPTMIADGGRTNDDPEHRFSAMPEPRPTLIANGGRAKVESIPETISDESYTAPASDATTTQTV